MVHVHMCMGVCLSPLTPCFRLERASMSSSVASLPYFLRQSLPRNLELAILAQLAGPLALGSSLSALGLKVMAFLWVLGI